MKGECIMVTEITLDANYKLTEKELAEIEILKQMKEEDIVFDEDCPELSPSMLKSLRCVAAQRDRFRKAN